MDVSTVESVKDELMKTSESFRNLIHEHESYEERLTQLAELTYPSDDEQVEEHTIKKKKLIIKDNIYTMMSEYSKSGS